MTVYNLLPHLTHNNLFKSSSIHTSEYEHFEFLEDKKGTRQLEIYIEFVDILLSEFSRGDFCVVRTNFKNITKSCKI